MTVGTRSLLFGCHQVLIHPWFVAYAWWKLYGFPWDPRLWVCFFVHDWGYWGCPDMDGEIGEEHPRVGAQIVHRLFDKGPNTSCPVCWGYVEYPPEGGGWIGICGRCDQEQWAWYRFVLYHSRFLAKRDGRPYTRLCVADKCSIVVTPRCLYFTLGRLSGEIYEYLERARTGKYASMNVSTLDPYEWHKDMCEYLKKWVAEHKDLKPDLWTGVKH